MQSMQSIQAKKSKKSKNSKHSKQSQNEVINITHSTKSEFKDESNYSGTNKMYNRSVEKRSNGLDYDRKNYVHSDIAGVTIGIILLYILL